DHHGEYCGEVLGIRPLSGGTAMAKTTQRHERRMAAQLQTLSRSTPQYFHRAWRAPKKSVRRDRPMARKGTRT
ncbi:MAG: hypothetical protein AB2796_05280, partial [Candidatus Thiodiazotropha sp.]